MDLSQPMSDEEPTIEVLFNNCYGGYSLPQEAIDLYKIRRGIPDTKRVFGHSIPRHDPVLGQLFKEFPELFFAGIGRNTRKVRGFLHYK